jgi:Ser/Thr protein kinase RdoA (MazF antagonist)
MYHRENSFEPVRTADQVSLAETSFSKDWLDFSERQSFNCSCLAFGFTDNPEADSLNGTFNVNWRITTSSGVYIMKRRQAIDESKSRSEVAMTDILRSIGIASPETFRTATGDTVYVDKSYCYSLFSFIDGREPAAHSYDDLALMGMALGELHRKTSASSIPEMGSTFQWRVSDWAMEAMSESLRIIPQECDKSLLSELNKKLLDSLAKIEENKLAFDLPQSFIHWDFHRGNVKFDLEGTTYIFDHEYTHIDDRIADVANSIILIAALDADSICYNDPASFIQECQVAEDVLRSFIRAYQREFPITDEEIGVLPAYLRVAWLGWVAYTFCSDIGTFSKLKEASFFPNWVERHEQWIQDIINDET